MTDQPDTGSGDRAAESVNQALDITADEPPGTPADKVPVQVNPAGETAAAAAPPAPAAGGGVGEVIDRRSGMFGVRGTGDTSGYGGLARDIQLPGPATKPYGGWFDEVTDRLEATHSGAVEQVVIHTGELTVHVHRDRLVEVCRSLRDDAALRFELFSGVSGVHYPYQTGAELHAVYHLLSLTHNRRLRLEVACPDADPQVPSVVAVYPAADWHERETYDFFGIVFDGHPALTRIQMPDDWPGHPQRKDYPLGGIDVEYKGAVIPPPDARRAYN